VIEPILGLLDPRPVQERVPLRRPRFTASEVLILNELVNRSPRSVTRRRLVQLLQRHSSRYYPITDPALQAHVKNLRAKLGEVARRPSMIVTTYDGGEPSYLYREEG
jgi:DNA-binding response OmpR family regulator